MTFMVYNAFTIAQSNPHSCNPYNYTDPTVGLFFLTPLDI